MEIISRSAQWAKIRKKVQYNLGKPLFASGAKINVFWNFFQTERLRRGMLHAARSEDKV